MTINVPLPKNWKTTAVGIAAAAYGFFQLYMINDWQHFVSEVIYNPTVLMAFLLAVLGIVGKDGNVTGGTVPATPEAKTRVDAPTPTPPQSTVD